MEYITKDKRFLFLLVILITSHLSGLKAMSHSLYDNKCFDALEVTTLNPKQVT